MRTLAAVTGVVVLLAKATSPGVAQVLDGPHGPVEFVGLQQWTAQELFDAIRELEPDRPFHACAAVMTGQLGFADAAAFLYFTENLDAIDQSSNRYTVVVGVEDSSRVRYRPAGTESIDLPEAWMDLRDAVGEDMNTLTVAARTLHMGELAQYFAEAMGADLGTVERIWELIGRVSSTEDPRIAHEILSRAESATLRAIATLVLGNFTDDDTSWHGLVEALIDPDGRVRTMAQSMLEGLLAKDWNSVGWSEAHDPLLALFGGTNPFAFEETLEVLVATGIDPEYGQRLVRERPELLLAFAGAEHEDTHEPALAFLRAISGEDFGANVDAWTDWIDG